MPFGDDVVAQAKAQPRALASGLGREKRLENLLSDSLRNARAVVPHPDFYPQPPEGGVLPRALTPPSGGWGAKHVLTHTVGS